jgi:hypothetical protein
MLGAVDLYEFAQAIAPSARSRGREGRHWVDSGGSMQSRERREIVKGFRTPASHWRAGVHTTQEPFGLPPASHWRAGVHTTQEPFGLPLNGMPPTFMPQMLAIKVAGRKITENIVSM